MDFTNIYFPDWFIWSTNIGATVLIAVVLYSLRGSRHLEQTHFNQWLWSVFFLCIVSLMRVTLDSGLNMHLSGAMLMALMFGWRMGLLGLCMVNTLLCVFRDSLMINLGIALLLNGLVPVTIAYFIFLLLEARLPRHFFIYIYGSAFFGSWIMSAITGLVIAICLSLFHAFKWTLLSSEFLPYYFIFGFSEAFLTSALITLFVAYRPDWVYSFRDQRYLQGK